MTEQQILNQILDQIKRTGPISSSAKAKALAKTLASKMRKTQAEEVIKSVSDEAGKVFQKPSTDNTLVKDGASLIPEEKVQPKSLFTRTFGQEKDNAAD